MKDRAIRHQIETIDKLYLELSQVTTAKTHREIELERLLRRQMELHASIAACLDNGPTEAGLIACVQQCNQFVGEARDALTVGVATPQIMRVAGSSIPPILPIDPEE